MFRLSTFAIFCGVGFTSFVSLAIHLTFLAAVFLIPGGVIQAIINKQTDSPAGTLVANSIIYSAIVLLFTSNSPKIRSAIESRRVLLFMSLPVLVLVCLACIPKLDPLWPVGMTQLAQKEAQLDYLLPIGMDVERTRAVLRSQGISFSEWVQQSDTVILERSDMSMSASSGDRVLSSEIPTDAYNFVCGYRIDLFLVFSKEDKLKQRYIHRFPICP